MAVHTYTSSSGVLIHNEAVMVVSFNLLICLRGEAAVVRFFISRKCHRLVNDLLTNWGSLSGEMHECIPNGMKELSLILLLLRRIHRDIGIAHFKFENRWLIQSHDYFQL